MGVPAFFRWLSRKYPSVIVECIEQMPTDVDGVRIPIDASTPNPNGIEFDNLYLDMNGIIHPCTHPEDKPAPKNEDEMMIAIFECVDRLFRIVRPRKLLYMAIDGVAPCAKMNQQRSRRFRASKEGQEKRLEVARIRQELSDKGANVPPEKEKANHFDLNCITPGTEFMDRLSRCLHYYIHDRLNNDPGWRGIKVVLSDAKAPGEGEHKIMDYIRRQRAQPDHDPNTQHVLCGADADLIMLGLATHEPNFTIIREEFKPNKPRPCDICGQVGHEMKECVGIVLEDATVAMTNPEMAIQDQYIFVRLNVLREYLEKELALPNLPFEYNFERILDDWVFMCFFVGNDFLPHLPSLEIREGAINRLVNLYKKTIYKTRGWLTDSGDVNLDSVQMIMSDLGQAEDEIFKKRQQTELMFKARDKARKRREKMERPNFNALEKTQFAPMPIGSGPNPVRDARREIFKTRLPGMQSEVSSGSHDSQRASYHTMSSNQDSDRRGTKRRADDGQEQSEGTKNEESDEEDHQVNDEVRLWEDGFKDRYYESKFDVAADNHQFRYNVALQYVRGLCWVLRYYYQGCASWKWYFPYHYAPFASDFVNIGGLSTQFEKGTKPIRPMEQLMSVFPAASGNLVPSSWATLMSDPESPIIDFYPEDFKIDLNGKKFAWQGVALLPFVEEKRLFKALASYYEDLTQAERMRNSLGSDRIYVGISNPSYAFIKNMYLEVASGNVKNMSPETEVPYSSEGVRGMIMVADDCIIEGGQLNSPVPGLRFITDNSVLCARYKDPEYPEDFIFPAVKLKGAVEPMRVLKPGDLSHEENRNYRPMIGMTRSNTQASLGGAGHRMIGHQIPGDRMYGNVQPPNNYYGSDRGDRGDRGGHRGGRSYDNNRGRGGYYGGRNDHGNRNDQGSYDSKRPRFGNDNYGHGNRDYGNSDRGGYSGRGSYQSRGGGGGGGGGGYNTNRGGYNSQDSNRQRDSRPGRDQSHPYSRERTDSNQWGYGQRPNQNSAYQRR